MGIGIGNPLLFALWALCRCAASLSTRCLFVNTHCLFGNTLLLYQWTLLLLSITCRRGHALQGWRPTVPAGGPPYRLEAHRLSGPGSRIGTVPKPDPSY